MEGLSLSELYSRRKQQYIQDCNLCGICVEACPTVPLTSLSSSSACDIQAKVMQLLGGSMSEEAAVRAASCAHCNSCRDTCPLDINPVILQELLQLELVKLTGKRRPLMELKLGDTNLFIPDILASMQVKPEQKLWLSRVPANPGHKDIVVFTGCAMVMMPDKIFLVREILKKLGLDFVVVSGGELCCGARYLGTDLAESESLTRKLLHSLAAFSPQQVIFCCAECTGRISFFDREISRVPFIYDEVFHFLSLRIEQMEFTQPVNKKVTLHDPCSLGRVLGDNTSLRRLLNAIPSISLVEMSKNREESICCGAVASRRLPGVGRALARQVLEEALKTGADVMVDACQGCHFQFCASQAEYPFQIENLLSLIGETMGIHFEDKLKKFYNYGDADKIMEECRLNVEAGPYDPGLTAMLAKHIFADNASRGE
ncbi:MAG: heterodisulfide reductase-related iron-sulfur binding cluster [Dehalococcoidia bacterium]